ncbi:hypothetical protein PP707_03580 [Acetobacter pasteurianus]|nr:hypothetical protein [Acetobacter pasteurianus]
MSFYDYSKSTAIYSERCTEEPSIAELNKNTEITNLHYVIFIREEKKKRKKKKLQGAEC